MQWKTQLLINIYGGKSSFELGALPVLHIHFFDANICLLKYVQILQQS